MENNSNESDVIKKNIFRIIRKFQEGVSTEKVKWMILLFWEPLALFSGFVLVFKKIYWCFHWIPSSFNAVLTFIMVTTL